MDKFNSEFIDYCNTAKISLYVCGMSLPSYLNSPKLVPGFTLGDKYSEFSGLVPRETFESKFNRRAKEIQDKLNKAKVR